MLTIALLAAAVAWQPPTARELLTAEYGRDPVSTAFIRGAEAADTSIQRLTARAIGRLESPELLPLAERLARSPNVAVRREAINALAQIGAPFPYATLLNGESSSDVRGAIFEALGRSRAISDTAEVRAAAAVLVDGLGDTSVVARAGAARGLESLLRRTARALPPTSGVIRALRLAAADSSTASIAADTRENALLALSAVGDRDSATITRARMDRSDQVRRVGALLARRYVSDPSYIVRLQGLRWAASCDAFIAATRDPNAHVALAAIDTLGGRACGIPTLVAIADAPSDWRRQAHAVVSLAHIAPDSARSRVLRLAASPVWQARAYATAAAADLSDSVTLARLARDTSANVAISALRTDADAIRALGSSHPGLIIAGVTHLAGPSARNTNAARGAGTSRTMPLSAATTRAILETLARLTAKRAVTTRDPRVAIIAALGAQAVRTQGDGVTVAGTKTRLRQLLDDRDPAVASAAAEALRAYGVGDAVPATVRYLPAPLPSEASMDALRGAHAVITMRSLGDIEILLLTDEAPVTTATFAQLAEAGKYDGLTFHRIVPNFVLQGGSPGANEVSPLTETFMRDEVGLVRHARGTFGISTRGRDTGDGQIFINLIDNFRLDHDYTVFARTLRGLDVIDRIQEGDIIEHIRIVRTAPASSRNR